MKPDEITSYQLWSATFGLLLVAAFYSLPRAVALVTSTAAPWAILLAGIVVFLMLWPTIATLSERAGQNLTDLALQGGGRPLAITVALVFNAAIAASVGLSLRQASELVVTALYPHTPQTFAMSTMMIASALGAAMAPPNTFWLASLYVWPTLVSILLLLLGNIGWGQFRNAMPPFGHGIGPTLWEVIPLTSHFSPLMHLLVFSSFLPSGQRLLRGTALAVLGGSVTWSLVILFYLMIFPLPSGLSVPFPLFEMSRLVQGGRFLERIDAIWVVIWAFGSVLCTAVALLAGARLYQEAFRLPDHRGAVLPLAIPTLAVALMPSNQADTIAVESVVFRGVAYLVFFALPLLVTGLAWIRGRSTANAGGDGGSAGA